jgi:hypothetical protein
MGNGLSFTLFYQQVFGITFISTLSGKPKIIKLSVPVQLLKFPNEPIIYTVDTSTLSPDSSFINDPNNNDTYTYTGTVFQEQIGYTVSQINPETNEIEFILPPFSFGLGFTLVFSNYTQNQIDAIPLNQGNYEFNKILFDGEIWQLGTYSSNVFNGPFDVNDGIQYELGNYRFYTENVQFRKIDTDRFDIIPKSFHLSKDLLNKIKLETMISFLNKSNIIVEVVNINHTDFLPNRVYIIVDDNNMINKVHLS